jgi:hypothetical protein
VRSIIRSGNNAEFKTVAIGQFEFKNVDEPVEVFALTVMDCRSKKERNGRKA